MSEVKLICGDCLEVLPTLETGSVNAVITDPPFGIDFKYNGYKDNPCEYEELMCTFVTQVNRLLHDGYAFVWQAMLQCKNWHKWFPGEYRIFAGLKNFVQFRPIPIQFSWDPIIFWKVGNPKLIPIAGHRDYHIGNTARYVAEKSCGHPCPRPQNTVEYIVNLVTLPSDTILDPFMGSGTTGLACVKLNRNFIGIEISEEYFKIAEKRIKEAQMQLSFL